MDQTDGEILQQLQDKFPICPDPYKVIAENIRIPVEELWSRIEKMLKEGIIRRMGVSLDSAKLGYKSTLAAIRIVPAKIESASEVVGRFPEVTHSYLRNDVYNIWFTIIAVDEKRIEDILNQIKECLSLQGADVLNLPMNHLYKLDARFQPLSNN